jgi:PqqD family protein of HPr-rel-A system
LTARKPTNETLWSSTTLLWRHWEQDIVVYNPISGNTHVLTPVAGQVLKLLDTGPASRAQIAQAISSAAGVTVDEEITREVDNLLTNLDELGLIRPVV